MQVLVTGAAGFIGDAVAAALRLSGHTVVAVDLANEDPCDVTDLATMSTRCAGVDAIVHLAAVADFADCDDDPVRAQHVNAGGTLAVLLAARAAGVRRVVYASTFWAYDGLAGHAVHESTPLAPPRSLYTASKLAGEAYCHAMSDDLEVVVCRLGTAYGPGARPALMTSRMLSLALTGNPLTVHGDGQQGRQLVFVEDLARGLVAALERGRPGETYNLVGRDVVSVNDVVAAVGRITGLVDVEHVPGRPGEVTMPFVSADKAAHDLGWRTRTELDDGLALQAAADDSWSATTAS